MAKKTPKELVDIASAALRNLTQDSEEVYIMAAIALAESGGETTATHKNANGSTDYGLWQINSVHKGSLWPTGPDAQGNVTSNGQQKSLFDPAYNAQLAATLYARRGNKWTDWSVYKSGKYKEYLPVVKEAGGADVSVGTTLSENTQKAVEAVDPLHGFADSLSAQIAKAASSSGALLIGLVLVVLGIVILLRKPIANVAGKATPVGKALNVAKAVTK